MNAAPYSFFNAFSADPPILGIGIGNREPPEQDVPKDTKANIRATGQFVVNLVDEAAGADMTAAPPPTRTRSAKSRNSASTSWPPCRCGRRGWRRAR